MTQIGYGWRSFGFQASEFRFISHSQFLNFLGLRNHVWSQKMLFGCPAKQVIQIATAPNLVGLSSIVSWEMKIWKNFKRFSIRFFFRKKNGNQNLHFNFSNGSCKAGVFDKLWWWWWCWLCVSCCKWFKLLFPVDMRPVIADETLTADATESCRLWWLWRWSFVVPLFVCCVTKSCKHKPCASLILCMPRSILLFFDIFELLSLNKLAENCKKKLFGGVRMRNI